MIGSSIVVAVVAMLAFALLWRRSFLRERPIVLWGRSFDGPSAASAAAAAAAGLSAERLADGWEWFADLLFSPVWFFWGDIRTRRPARQLRRWRLVGTREGRGARVRFGDDELFLELDEVGLSLWAEPPRIRAFDEQEGLRPLLPVDGARWRAGTPILLRLFALGVAKLSGDGQTLIAQVRPSDAVPPEAWSEIFSELDALRRAARDEPPG